MFAKSRKIFDEVLQKADYRAALRFFNCKGIPAHIAVEFNIKRDRYIEIVLDILRQEPEGSVAKAMRELSGDQESKSVAPAIAYRPVPSARVTNACVPSVIDNQSPRDRKSVV